MPSTTEIWDEAARHMMAAIRIPQADVDLDVWLREHESFYPHWGQQKVIDAIKAGAREIDVIASPRSGKSELARKLAKYAVMCQAKRCWILAPTWDDVDRLYLPLWEELQQEASRRKTIITSRDKETRLLKLSGGGFVEGVSWATLAQIEAQGIDMAITDESQYLTEPVANKIRDRLEGDSLWIRLGRPAAEGASFYETLANEYANVHMPGYAGPICWPRWANPDPKVRRTVQIEIGLLRQLRKTLGKDHPQYKQRYRHFLVSFAGHSVQPPDIAIGTFDPAIHVQDAPFNPDLPVYLGIDPGYYPSAYAVTVFQPHPHGTMLKTECPEAKELWQIDELYLQRTITDDVINLCKTRPWWRNVTRATIDVAARQSNRQTGTSELAIWQKRTTFPVTTTQLSVDDGLSIHRTWLANNRLFHDRTNCPHTIREYSLYKMRKRGAGDVKDTPIDANNHALKAIAYLLADVYGVVDAPLAPLRWRRSIKRPTRRRYL